MSKAYKEFDHLETERLILRPFTEADYPLILRISSDPKTTEYLYYWGLSGITPEADARRFLDYAIKNWKKSPILPGAERHRRSHRRRQRGMGGG